MSAPTTAFPTDPTVVLYSGVNAEIGAVSVNPYPCRKMIPKSVNHCAIFLSIGAAADTIILNFPPRFAYISLNTFLLQLIPIAFSAFVIPIIDFTSLSL